MAILRRIDTRVDENNIHISAQFEVFGKSDNRCLSASVLDTKKSPSDIAAGLRYLADLIEMDDELKN